MSAPEPALYDFEISVCAECLHAKGSKCHTPGCAFWLHDVPQNDTAAALRDALHLSVITRRPCELPCPLCENSENGYCDMPDRHDRSDYSPHHCERCGRSWSWWS